MRSPVTTHFESAPKPGQKHEHLLSGRVLCFIENDKRLAERSSTHVGERRNFDDSAIHVLLNLLHLKHVVKGIVKRTQIRKDFLLQVPGQKAKRLPGLDRRASQDDPADFFLLERRNGHRHGKIRLPRPGGADSEGNIAGLHGEKIRLLAIGLRHDRRLARRCLDSQIQEVTQVRAAIPAGRMHRIIELRAPDDHPALSRFVQLLEDFPRPRDAILAALNSQPSVPRGDPDVQSGFQLAEKLVITAVESLHGAGVIELERERFQITYSHKRAPSRSALEAIFPR